MCAAMSAQQLKVLSCSEGFPQIGEPPLQSLGISPNGEYVCGSIAMGAGIFVADLKTDEVKWELIDDDEGGELRHVDNNGLAIGLGHSYVFDTGTLIVNEVPEGYRSVLYEDLTNDGNLIVGSLNSTETHAAYLKAGEEWKMLPIPPDDELMGYANKLANTSAAKLVSGDGNVIFGFLGSFILPILWYRNDAGDYDYDFFISRLLKTEIDDDRLLIGLSSHYLKMSNNGRYVSFLGAIYDEAGREFFVPVIYDTVAKEAKIYTDKQEIDEAGLGLYPTSVCDDGTFIGSIGQPYFGSVGSFIMYAGQTQAELFIDAFPEFGELLGESDFLGFNMPTGMSADGSKISGYTFYADDYNDMETPAYYISYVISTGKENAVGEISSSLPASSSDAVYSVDGRMLRGMTKGLNIVRHSDGSVSKILRK